MEGCFGKALERYSQSEGLNCPSFKQPRANDSFWPIAACYKRQLPAKSRH